MILVSSHISASAEESLRIKLVILNMLTTSACLKKATENALKQLDALSDVAKEVGLLNNIDKTKVLPKNINPKPEIMLDGTVLEVVADFRYLQAFTKIMRLYRKVAFLM